MTVDDKTLERMLTDNGLSLIAAEVRDLLAGIIAAPPPTDNPLDWLALIMPNPPTALRAALLALHGQMKATMMLNDGLGPGPAAPERLHALRAELNKRELDGVMIPRADEHQGEHVPRQAERLNWLTGFTGSAGMAIVLRNEAALFVDGRYILQAGVEINGTLFKLHHLLKTSPAEWLTAHAAPGQCIGYDPWLHTLDGVRQLEAATERAGIQLKPCDTNPLDAVWYNQPSRPLAPIVPHFLSYAGQSEAEKRHTAAIVLARVKADATVLTAPDSIAWLLNIRGGDVPYSPLPLAFAILHADAQVELFLDRRKLTPAVIPHIGQAVRVLSSEAFGPALDALGQRGARVCLDVAIPAAVSARLRAAGAHITYKPNPCTLLQACKNEVELDGLRVAHRRDGIALVQFLCWLETTIAKGYSVTELTAADQLEAFRRKGAHFRGLSFATISATGPNGAIVHYRATQATDRKLQLGSLYLVDSGAQYLDGTTDVTRTIAIGPSEAETRRRFTQVLKGHIALAVAIFPVGTTGSQLDVLARQSLWADGVDYDHGTGHGVGCYLNVHEGPHRIAAPGNDIPLVPGMVVSDEPAYYKIGAYGIRIENLLTVRSMVPQPVRTERSLLAFEVLTLAPFDQTLIESALLSPSERAWVDIYHNHVRDLLTPLLDLESATWLIQKTSSLT